MYPILVLSLLIQTATSKDCSPSACIGLSKCPKLQKLLANPPIAKVDELKNLICDSEDDVMVCCKDSFNSPTKTSTESRNENCGYQDSIYEFPWMASLMAFGWSVCSGALINERYVLTAASCASPKFHGDSLVKIFIGDFNLKSSQVNCSEISHMNEDECAHFQKFEIEKSIPHPLHNNSFNNIGLIRLNRKVNFTDYIRPICLPSQTHIYAQPGDKLKTSGFVINYDPILKLNRFKKKLTTRFLPIERCRNWLKEKGRNTPLSLFNTCSEDSVTVPEFINYFVDHGGPIMIPHDNQWYVESILALASDDTDIHRPIINTNISYYLDWIYNTMEPWD